ncbi:hypothetical protein QWY93_12615 [Echinicola jeungdonensis]|uniref:Lipoprotein n=1 Tax=Echinicola jeungdonensis TaxID=709343 RepID=A0ABV5J912_9BACT|nr:hypothetical protein [Echinicola jeungdonensis]MDN3670168.1 hypothetical protein [Echinicola jeungdonensis]
MSRALNIRTWGIFLIAICLTLASCASRRINRELFQVEQIKNVNEKYLKVHLKNGDLYVLHSWKTNEATKTISGLGNYLDHNRKVIESRGAYLNNKKRSGRFPPFEIPYGEIVIVESNDKGNNPGVPVMVILGLSTISTSVSCIADPKSCFGSCPTFYAQKDSVFKLVAEGFSSSISPSFEKKDIDLLDFPLKMGAPLQITVKNEALETHMIRQVNLRWFVKNLQVTKCFRK